MKRRDFLKLSGSAGLITLITPTGIVHAFTPQFISGLENSFINPPAAARPYTMWFWMNGQVTKQGITMDLEAMKRVGIGGVFNFDAGTGIPKGPLEYLSDDWVDMKKFAIAEAERLGMAYTMHNCPGWSSSGGPWITPDISMQVVTWSESYVSGGKTINKLLPKPSHKLDYYKDVAVIAYPSLQGEGAIEELVKKVSDAKGTIDLKKLTGNSESVIIKPIKNEAWLLFEFNNSYEAGYISFLTASVGYDSSSTKAEEPILLEVSEDGLIFSLVTEIKSGSDDPLAPKGSAHMIAAEFPAISGKYFRLRTTEARSYGQINFSGLKKFTDWEKRANFVYNGTGKRAINDPGINMIPSDKVIDITTNVSDDGILNWKAPQGKWTILRIGHTTNGEVNRAAPDSGIGLECDKYSKKAIDFHFSKMMDILLPVIGPMVKTGKMGLEIDSFEVGMQNWTPGFETSFEKNNGYSLLKYLPAITGRIVDSVDTTERFLWDFRRTQGDMIADNYYGRFDELCNNNGIISFIQPYDRGPMEEMQIGSRADSNMGEFWNGLSAIFQNNQTMRRTIKLAASVAHVNGQSIVGAESFTSEPGSARWQEYPFHMKAVGDKAFTQGVNRMIIHRFAHQPHPTAFPGMTMGPWGIHFDRTNTWWEQGKAWLGYLWRCQALLQQGLLVADLIYFSGEDAGVYTTVNREALNPIPPFGYDYDLINAETIKKRVKIVNSRIVLPDGMNYQLFVLQDYKTITLPFLNTILDLVNQGMIMVGARPERTPGLRDYNGIEDEFQNVCDTIWGKKGEETIDHIVGKGRVFWGQSIKQILEIVNLNPDFEVSSQSGDAPIIYIHRVIDDSQVYFIANQRRTTEEIVCTLRVNGRIPELWDAKTGTITALSVYQFIDGGIRVPLTLDPYGSIFLIFRSKPAGDSIVSVSKENVEVLGTSAFPFVQRKLYKEVTDNFTISFWVKPELDIMLGTKNYMEYVKDPWTDYHAIYPTSGKNLYGEGHATVGLTVGRNGVAVWEHGSENPVMVLAAPVSISGWSHLALVYKDGIPTVYVNGVMINKGVQQGKNIHPGIGESYLNEGGQYYNGDMTTPQLFTEDLNENKIKELASVLPNTSSKWNRIVEPTNQVNSGLLFWENGRYQLTNNVNKKSEVSISGIGTAHTISGVWDVYFPSKMGAPEKISLPKLSSLHNHSIDGVKYFSGTAIYKNAFSIPSNEVSREKRFFLDLGRVEVLAEVIVNGKNLGILWSRPYLVDITDAIKSGVNNLEVKVTNLWPNRLIGDDFVEDSNKFKTADKGDNFAVLTTGAIETLPDWYKEGKPKPDDGRVTFTTWKHHTKDSPLLESGLIGPVVIRTGIMKTV
ncbi:glycosyl hydrolase [Flavobacterium sp. ZT3R17]|uniref:glycosyl hydrolase n=1 Tax=Flavobacterium cryoconiti TaxID=3398736 RepID=UPI003A8A6526